MSDSKDIEIYKMWSSDCRYLGLVTITWYLICTDGRDQQSCGDGKMVAFSRSNSDAMLEISDFCRHMERLTTDEVWFDFRHLIKINYDAFKFCSYVFFVLCKLL